MAASSSGEGDPLIPTRGGNRRRVHTDPDCPLLERSDTSVRPASDIEVDRFGECKHCTGEIDREKDQGPRPEKKLRDMDVEEFDAHLKEEGLA